MFTLNLTPTPGRVFGKGGIISTVSLFWRAATGQGPGDTRIVQHEWLEVWLVGFYTIGSIAKENFVLPPLRATL